MSVDIRHSNPGWLKRLLSRYSGDSVIAVGFPMGSDGASTQYPKGESVLDVAARNEFGMGVPERSFLRTGGLEFVDDSQPLFKKAIKRVNEGGDLESELDKIGLKAVAAIQQKIVDVKEPANADSTIARKKSSNPLIDTGLMRQSVTYEVR